MRIVIIRSNAVRPDSRVEKEAYSLIKAGHIVTILAWDRDRDHASEQGIVTVAGIEIPIIRIGHKAGFGLGIKSLKPYILFQRDMILWLKKNEQIYDAIHACDFDTAFFSQNIARKKRKKFVFDIFDFLGSGAKDIKEKLLIRLQFRIINRADATIICTEDRKRQIAGSTPKQLVVIHNTPFATQQSLSKEKFNLDKQKVKVVYIGILQDHRLLLDIGEYFNDNPQYEFHIGGFGKYESHFSELAKNCSNIYFYGRLPYQDTLALERACDIMLAIYDPTIDNHRFAAPNKFYESLMLGKPLIMVKGTGMSEYVSKNDIGVLIDYSRDDFGDGLNKLVSKKSEWQKMKTSMYELYQNEFAWEYMACRLSEIYYEL